MAQPVNLVPNIGINEQAVAGNQAAIFTATDREVIKRRVGEIEGRHSFAQKIRSLFSKTDAVDEIRDSQDAALKPQNEFSTIKNEAKIHRHLIKHRQTIPQDRVLVSTPSAEQNDSFKDKEAQLEKVKVYAQSYISSLHRPESPEKVAGLDKYGIDKGLGEKVEDDLYQDLYRKVKEKIELSASGEYLSKLVWSLPNAQVMLDVFMPQEKVTPPTGVDTKKKRIPTFNELVYIARRLEIDLPAWLKTFDYETVVISKEAKQTGKHKTFESWVPVSAREFVKLTMQRVLSRNLFQSFRLGFKISSVRSDLLHGGLSLDDVKRLERRGRKIAFMKVIMFLKHLHLRRVFSSTTEDFEKCSKEIKYYNKKLGRLGFEISDKGLKWIRKNFEALAYKIAIYKFNLLKSMQSLGFDKKRETEIHKLEAAIERIKSSLH